VTALRAELGAELGAELRAVRWGPVAGGLAAAVGLAVLDLTIWPGGPGSQLLWLVAGLLGASVATALDDPAATITGALPTPRWWRAAIRLLVAVGALVAWSAYVARVADAVSAPGEPVSWIALVLIGTALVLVTAGPAAALGRSGTGEPGSVVASMAVVSVLGLMILPLPLDIAAYDISERWTDATALWTVLGAIGAAALAWGVADPWRPRFGQRRTAAIVSRYQP
jgi:hypothetical protein